MSAITAKLQQQALLVMLLACSISLCLYWRDVPGALQMGTADAGSTKAKPLTDLYPRWYGARELLLHHRDPYGPEVSREIQIAYYGRVLNPALASDRLDQKRFAYPAYVVFLMAPTVFMEFPTVQIVFWWLLAAVAACSIWFWLRFLRLHLAGTALVVVFSLGLTCLPMLQGLSLLQLGVVVAGLISAASLCVVSGHFFLAGTLLAIATIKPQMSFFPIAWFLLWALSAWGLRKSLAWGFGLGLLVLVLASEYLLPGWLMRYPSALAAYSDYQYAPPLLSTLLPRAVFWVSSTLAILGVTVFCWRVRQAPGNSVWFAIALVFVMTLTVSVLPTVNALFNQVLLFPAILLGIRYRRLLTQGSRLNQLIFCLICGCGVLPWMLAAILMVVRPNVHDQLYLAMWSAPLYSSFRLPVVVFLFLILLCRALVTESPDKPDDASLAGAGAL